MKNNLVIEEKELNNIYTNIKELIINSRNNIYRTVNTEMVSLYWNIGKIIMQMYVNYYDRDIKRGDENPTIGILLSTDRNKTVVKYTLPEDNNTIFSSEYKLHLPTERELINMVEEEKKNIELYKRDHRITIRQTLLQQFKQIEFTYCLV